MRTSLKHLHNIAVLVAKERDRTARFGFVFRSFVMPSRRVFQDVGSDKIFNRDDFVLAQRVVMREVETKSIGSDKRTLLLHMVAEGFAQCPMKKMRCGVIALDRIAAFAVNDCIDALTDFDVAFENLETMSNNSRSAVDRFDNASPTRRRSNDANVANLTA